MFGFKKKTIADNVKDFEHQYKAAQIISYNYLTVWFKQVFDSPDYKELFADNPKISEALAIEILKYLSAQDPKDEKTKEYESESDKETFEMARKHVHKWTDDVMEKDKDFRELRIQTLRLDMIYSQLANEDFLQTPKGKRIAEIMMKYGKLVPEEPTPEKYTKMIQKWIQWDDSMRRQGII